ncbi:MAG TPA: hypothetical protein VLA56_04795, partial [Pseudomonadales bacterium]|nr:hypothetical protein [Pseudomonadales bacterium]
MGAMRIVIVFLGSVLVACTGETPSPAVEHAPGEGEVFFSGLRQITFGGQNAEAYFSPDGTRLIFQRTVSDSSCDQQYIMNVDGSNVRQVSRGGRTTCGYFYQGGSRILYSSTVHADSACPAPPDFSRGYVWPIPDFDIYTANADGSDERVIARSPFYDAEATLSPDGSRIVFTSTRDGDLDIYTMNVDGSDIRRLT